MRIDEIMSAIPHRYPFLFVDKVIEMDKDKIVALKNVSINEFYFQGHFPSYPLVPGVLQIEGIAQCAGILLLKNIENKEEIVPLFMGIEKAKFRSEVRPGDQMIYKVRVIGSKLNVCKLEGTVEVNGKLCTEAIITVGQKPMEEANDN
ncbi:MAG: 3-hydroxyacyl-ACP dehydratase FabZ [Thermotogota bacterium]|nr:3-hydroxyacyl-ACP dehydratase FabZ [Thermotogota bacterium]